MKIGPYKCQRKKLNGQDEFYTIMDLIYLNLMSDERWRAGWIDRWITIGRPQSRLLINLIKTDILDQLPLNEYISGGALKTLFFILGFKDHNKVIHNDH